MNKIILTAVFSVMVLAAACGGGEASTVTAPTVRQEKSTVASPPTSTEARDHFEAGFALEGKGQLEEAIAEYGEAIRLDPRFAFAYSNRGNVYDNLGQHQLALEDLDKAIRLERIREFSRPGDRYVEKRRHRIQTSVASG